MTTEAKIYGERDIEALDEAGGYYSRHVHAMTGEGLDSKRAIASELAYRDHAIDVLTKANAELREMQYKLHPILTRDQVREVFLENGFTVKEGNSDLKEYAYTAATALLNKARYLYRVGRRYFPNGEEIPIGYIKPDTLTHLFYYEQDFYVFSSFSSFQVMWKGNIFPTLEHAYHWEKFPDHPKAQQAILAQTSAHDAFKLAKALEGDGLRRTDWKDEDENGLQVCEKIMEELMYFRTMQHPYQLKKLIQSGTRILVEDSHRDAFWGWGPDQTGRNAHGKAMMRVRDRVFREERQRLAEEAGFRKQP